MTDFELSMHYERVFGHLSALHVALQEQYNTERRNAAKEGREPDKSYDDKLENLKVQKAKYRKLSDEYYRRHRRKHPGIYDDDSLDNLIVAIMQRAALDYGMALSTKDLVLQSELERFADGYGQELTSMDMGSVFESLKIGYGRFCKIVDEHHDEIIADNKAIAKRRDNGERRFTYRYHCPICRGQILNGTRGRKPKTARQTLVFRCNHCNFTKELMLNG